MKKHSLIFQELLTDGVMGFVFIVTGILGFFQQISLLSVIISLILFFVEVSSIVLRKKKRFDIWDETARAHYSTAQKITLNTLILCLHILIIVFLLFKISVDITVYHIFLIVGVLLLMISAIFVVLEKRGV